MSDYYTENLAEFGALERAMAAELLSQPLPEGFDNSGVRVAMNKMSGYVFLVNDDYQCAMMNGDSLAIHHTTPYNGHEGFLSYLTTEYAPDDMHPEDVEYIRNAAENERFGLPDNWKGE